MKRKFDASQVPGFIPLDTVSVASPCHADWNAMTGDDQSRFCPSCAKNVYNLSAMTSDQAQELLQEKEGRLCIRFYQREDGTMLTKDCPVGAAQRLQASPSFALWAGTMALVVAAFALGSPTFLATANAQPDNKSTETPLQTATPSPTPVPACVLEPAMGKVAIAPKATPAPPMMGAMVSPPVAPKATPAPEPSRMMMGDMAVAPTPQVVPPMMGFLQTPAATPAPTPPPVVTMGLPAFKPNATPAPEKVTTMGEAQIEVKPTPKPTALPRMGRFIVSPATKPAAKVGKSKTAKASKKTSSRKRGS